MHWLRSHIGFINFERLIHSVKTVIACMIGLLCGKFVGFPTDQWVIISILVVMCAQIYVGSVLQKAYLRMIGTLIGCIIAAFTIQFFGTSFIAIALTIAFASFIFSFIATTKESLTYASTLGAVTTAIIMLGQPATILFASQRFLEISLGILIATLVSQFVLPINARTHLRRAQAVTLEQLRDYYVAMMTTLRNSTDTDDYQELDESIVKSLLKQRQLAKESAREPIGARFNAEHFTQTLICEREMLRAITFMHNALTHVQQAEKVFISLPAAHQFNEGIVEALNTLIEALKENKLSKAHIHTPSFSALRQEIQAKTASTPKEEVVYFDGFLCSAEILTGCLTKLANLYDIKICHPERSEGPPE